MYVTSQSRTESREGMILLVVLIMLTLFCIVGLSFVLYANSQADLARVQRVTEDLPPRPSFKPEEALALFLSQFIYDVKDDADGVQSAIRGHSLARTMYGMAPAFNSGGPVSAHHIDKAFNGTGRVPTLLNYTYFSSAGSINDPDYLNTRTDPNTPPSASQFVGQSNPGYTYPDESSLFLAMVRAADGRVLIPSYHRPWWFNLAAAQSDPDWADANYRTRTLRPRPAEHSAFPYPEDSTGDVKNLPGNPGGNDSIWIDIGAPVMTTADGRKFKPLFAPLIMELDGKINVNVAGNIMGNGNSHASHQGWGPWEMSLAKLWQAVGEGDPDQWKKLLQGDDLAGGAQVFGRYGHGASAQPDGTALAGGTSQRAWAKVDYNANDGQNGSQGSAVSPLTLPNSFSHFPIFGNGHDNGVPTETINHAAIYNALRTPSTGDDRLLSAKQHAAILRMGENPYEVFLSDMIQLSEDFFHSWKGRYLTTPISFDLDRPKATPYVLDPEDGMTEYRFPDTDSYPKAMAPISVAQLQDLTSAPATGDFDQTTRRSKAMDAIALGSALAQHGRVDLTRKLTNFPAVDANDGSFADPTSATQAIQDRQQFARDIYNALCAATGCQKPTTALDEDNATADERSKYDAARWLAQLAANIVDYIDQDDYNTPFEWVAGQQQYVFGTELPRLVLNEVYMQINNHKDDDFQPDPNDNTRKGAARDYKVHFWIELHNPVPDDSATRDDCRAILQRGTGATRVALYRVILAKDNLTAAMTDRRNVRGEPTFDPADPATPNMDQVLRDYTAANDGEYKILDDWTDTSTPAPDPVPPVVVLPTTDYRDAAKSNTGFYVIGPDKRAFKDGTDPTEERNDPGLPVTLRTTKLTWTVNRNGLQYGNEMPLGGATATLLRPTIVLQRLACPGLPPNAPEISTPAYDPALPLNPYITLDYIEHNEDKFVEESRTYRRIDVNDNTTDAAAPIAAAADGGPRKLLADRTAWGRKQPYAAVVGMRRAQTAVATDAPKNTFYRHNAETDENTQPMMADNTLEFPFTWLTHLDRQPISPPELFHVSAFRPHQLMQTFITANNDGSNELKNRHVAQWTDETTRLYRFLEFANCKSRANGVVAGGRVPGKVNINMVWDLEVFEAICDANSSNRFTDMEVQNVWSALLNSRSQTAAPALPDGSSGGNMPGSSDKPFRSLAIGPASMGDAISSTARGIDSTLLRRGSNGRPIFESDTTGDAQRDHPYFKNELLTKVFNNFTTTSNCFAVWVTIGFFEVTDENARPVQLGAEIGRAEGKHVRHRMFAIVDRSRLMAAETTSSGMTAGQQVGLSTAIAATTGTNQAGNQWSITDGTLLTFSPDTDNEETVVVNGGNVTCNRSHPTHTDNGVTYQGSNRVIVRGNPGPWAPRTYHMKKDTDVVLYWAIIE